MNSADHNPNAEFFVTGGTMLPDAPSYVERRADRDLREYLLEGKYCYVLTARQMGKSSLTARTAVKSNCRKPSWKNIGNRSRCSVPCKNGCVRCAKSFYRSIRNSLRFLWTRRITCSICRSRWTNFSPPSANVTTCGRKTLGCAG